VSTLFVEKISRSDSLLLIRYFLSFVFFLLKIDQIIISKITNQDIRPDILYNFQNQKTVKTKIETNGKI
jgi:hypothetical protein